MPFIWNDETYWDRIIQSKKVEKIIFILFLINIVFFYLVADNLSLKDILVVSLVSSLFLFSLIDLFKKYRLPYIPDSYSQRGKQVLRCTYSIIHFMAFCWLLNYYKIL